MAMTRSSPQTRLPTVAAVMTLRGKITVQLSSSVPSLQSTWPSQRQLSYTHLQREQRAVCYQSRLEENEWQVQFHRKHQTPPELRLTIKPQRCKQGEVKQAELKGSLRLSSKLSHTHFVTERAAFRKRTLAYFKTLWLLIKHANNGN